MPDYHIANNVLDISRSALLLDTGVLVAAFAPWENSVRKEYAERVLEVDEGPLLISTVVLVEAWGVLVGGKSQERPVGLKLLTWLNLPGRVTILPAHHTDMQRTQQIIGTRYVDCVDAMLVDLATDITERCNLRPSLYIATFDTDDFTRMSGKHNLHFNILDMRSMERMAIG